ncbi:MAG: ATP-binding protein [Deltaproteobacteria bacterium]|nr:ATP-binding protein [Deltaproteobacteria bacterium]
MGQGSCGCPSPQSHQVRRVVLTGGPGAGKTAVLEVVRKHLCEHVVVLPEAAGIVYGGGFPRRSSVAARRAGQLAIYHVQDQLEAMALAEGAPALVLCDRGVLDGLAYWPGEADQFFEATGTERSAVFGRYASVIHLRTPSAAAGYNRQNPLRLESADEASVIDQRLLDVWKDHPRRMVVECEADFLDKLERTLAFLLRELPACCRGRGIH